MHPQINTTERGKAIAEVILGYPEMGTLDEHISYAHALADLGVHVCVTVPGFRSPEADFRTDEQRAEDIRLGQNSGGFNRATTDKQRLSDYITAAYRKHGCLPGLGIHLGASGIIAVDADNEGDAVEWSIFQDRRCREAGITPEANPFTTLSPGKYDEDKGGWRHRHGVHCWYLLDVGTDPSTLKTINEKSVTGEIADEALYPRDGWGIKVGNVGVFISPTVRKEGAYRPGRQGAIPVAPQWLIDLMTKPTPKPKPAPTCDDLEFNESVDDAMASVSWGEILEGVALDDGVNSCGCTIFTRPGGSRRSMLAHDGCDAVNGAHCLTVNSDTIMSMYPALQDILDKRPRSGRSFSKWEALAAFQFGGDMGAVAQQYGFSRPSTTAADWDGVFVDANVPFTSPLTAPLGDMCPHGVLPSQCPPCATARRISLLGGAPR